jgi:hypothetical protein
MIGAAKLIRQTQLKQKLWDGIVLPKPALIVRFKVTSAEMTTAKDLLSVKSYLPGGV